MDELLLRDLDAMGRKGFLQGNPPLGPISGIHPYPIPILPRDSYWEYLEDHPRNGDPTIGGKPGISLWSPSFRGIMPLHQEPQCAEFGKKSAWIFRHVVVVSMYTILQDPCMVCFSYIYCENQLKVGKTYLKYRTPQEV